MKIQGEIKKMMRKLSKILAVILALAMMFTIAACSVTPPDDGGNNPTPPQPKPEEMTVSEYTAALNRDVYTASDLSGTYGLSDGENVGVNKAETQKDKFQMPADSTFENGYVLDFETVSETADSDSKKLDTVISKANSLKADGKNIKIKFPNRRINIRHSSLTAAGNADYTIVLNDFNGLYIEGGSETVLMIEVSNKWVGGLSFNNCTNLHIEGVRVDYLTASVLTGVVSEVDEAELAILMIIPKSMHNQVLAYAANPTLVANLYSMIQYNRYTNAPQEGGIVLIKSEGFFENVLIVPDYEMEDGTTEDVIAVKFAEGYRDAFVAPSKNDKFAFGFTMYGNSGFTINNSKQIYVEDCTVYTSPGMAFTVSNCENIYINRVNFEKTGDRLMTATADGFHINACIGDVSITNCLLENTHDDALNIKSGYYYTVSNYDSVAKTFVITLKTEAISAPKEGDKIEIYNQEDFSLLGTFTVVSTVGNASAYTVTVKERISGTIDWSKAVVTNVSNSAKFTFSNNIVRNKRNRGILVQVRGALIENNTFNNIGHGAVSIHSSLDIFNEATMPRDIIIRNNKLMNNGYFFSLRGDISVFAIADGGSVAPSGTLTGIEIYNNYITDSGNAGISLRGVGGKGSYINNNLFYNAARVSASEMTEGCLELENVSDIAIKGNYNFYTGGSPTHAGIITAGLTKTDTLVMSNNFNLNFQVLGGEVKKVNVGKLANTDITIDGNISEWQNKGTVIDMDGASIATGEPIRRDTYKDVFDVLMCKLAWTEDGIYFAFDVKDNKADYKTAINFWTGDCVEVFMSDILDSENADFQLYRNDGDVMQMALVPTWSTQFGFGANRTNDKFVKDANLIKVKMNVRDGDGYSGEAFLPFTLFTGAKEKIDNGKSIAMAFIFADNDRDEISRKRVQVGSVPHFVEAYKLKTAKMPLYTFVEA